MNVYSKINQIILSGRAVLFAENTKAKGNIFNSSDRLLNQSTGQELLSGEFYYFTPFSGGLAFSAAEGELLHFYRDGEQVEMLAAGFFFNLYENRSDESYLILSQMKEDFSLDFFYYDLKVGLTELPFHCDQKENNTLLSFDMRANTLKVFNLSSREISLVYDGKGKRISRISKPILISDKIIFSLEKSGFVILSGHDFSTERIVETLAEGNQLVIADATRNSVYVFFGQGIEQFDLETGQKVCDIQFSIDNSTRSSFSGPFWQFADNLVVTDTQSGTVIVIDADSLEVKHLVQLNGPGIPNAKDKVIMLEDRLFIHAMDANVYVFDLEAKMPA